MAKSVTIDFNARLAKFEKGITKATQRLNKFQRDAKRNAGVITTAFNRAGLKIAGIFGGLAIGNAFITTATEIEKLKASLVSVTGSTEAAGRAFNLIDSFAAKTPYSIQELTSAFVKLKALGLDPSEDAITSFGNTASAMGKSLDQFVEAVADAVTGEFERLKEFGIKASSQGDKVAFTFQGITKTVGKNAAEIEKYLRSIGNVQFAGAMDRQAATLGGAFSNAGDAIGRFMVQLGESGVNGAIRTVVIGFTDATNAVTAFIDSFRDIENRTNVQYLTDQLFEAQEALDELLAKQDGSAKRGANPWARFIGHYNREIKSTLKTINELNQRLNELEGPNITPKGTDKVDQAVGKYGKLREAIEGATSKNKAFAETAKLFGETTNNKLDDSLSDAAKVSKTFNLIGEALTLDRKGADASETIEKAAAAINQLGKDGSVADQTIKDMKASLEGIWDSKELQKLEKKVSVDIDDERAVKAIAELTKPGKKVVYVEYVPINDPSGGSDSSAEAIEGRP